jgi:hypothetical protein
MLFHYCFDGVFEEILDPMTCKRTLNGLIIGSIDIAAVESDSIRILIYLNLYSQNIHV